MEVLRKAFFSGEQNSMMVLARSKQTLNALMNQLENDIRLEMENPDQDLKVIKVNATLNNSENKIQTKFCEALGLKDANKSLTSVEMMNQV